MFAGLLTHIPCRNISTRPIILHKDPTSKGEEGFGEQV
jgi:hypothetical protein